MSMELTLEWEPNQSKKLVVDEFISVPELKQMCCCEAASAPMYTRVMFGDQTLLGNQDKLANEYGIKDGSVLKLVMKNKTKGMWDGLFQAKIQDSGAEYSEEDYIRFCSQLEKAFPVGTLDFTGQQIGMNILTKLTKVLRESKHIRAFMLYGNLIRDHGIHSLYQLLITNPRVVILDIGCNDLTNQAVPAVIDIILGTEIVSLQIGATGIAWHNNKFNTNSLIEIINAVHQANRIECLGLSGLKLSVRQGARRLTIAEELANFINVDQYLKSLSISNCGFIPHDVEVVTQCGLLHNNRIKFLDMHDNPLADPVGPEFTSKLNRMTSLTYLNLSKCQLSPEAGKALASSLETGCNLIVLDLSNNNIGDEGFMKLLDVILNNNTLTELDVSNNNIGPDCSDKLEEVISKNQIICSLDLSINNIGDEGAYAIAASIGENVALTKLSVASCRITDKGAISLTSALVSNYTLRRFKINDNFLTRESGYNIIDQLRRNEHLFVIDLSATQIDHFVIKAANDICIRNKQIQRETDLQPLKKQLVQLSIQQTKMPEAEMHLRNLEETRDNIEKDIVTTEGQLENTQITANQQLRQLQKAIQETRDTIKEEEQSIQSIAADGEKIQLEFDNRYQEILGNTEKEKSMIASYENDIAKLEKEMTEFEEESAKKKEAMEKELEQLNELLQATMQIMQDPDLVHDYEAPDLDFLKPPEEEPFFIAEQLAAQAKESSRSRRSNKSTKSKKSKSSKKSKK